MSEYTSSIKSLIPSLSLPLSCACTHERSLSHTLAHTLPPSLPLPRTLFFSCTCNLCVPSLSLYLSVSSLSKSWYTYARCNLPADACDAHSHRHNMPYVCVSYVCVCMQGHQNPLKISRFNLEGLLGLQQVSSLSRALDISSLLCALSVHHGLPGLPPSLQKHSECTRTHKTTPWNLSPPLQGSFFFSDANLFS